MSSPREKFLEILWRGSALQATTGPLLTLVFNAFIVLRRLLTLGLWSGAFVESVTLWDALREVGATVLLLVVARYFWCRLEISTKLLNFSQWKGVACVGFLGVLFHWFYVAQLVNHPPAHYDGFSNYLQYYLPDYWLTHST